VRVRLAQAGGRITRIEVRSERARAEALISQAAPGEAPQRAASLYGVCAQAHRLAATGALHAALGDATPPPQVRLAERARTEWMFELGREILIDWPRLAAGTDAAATRWAAALRDLAAGRIAPGDRAARELLEGAVLGETADAWFGRWERAALTGWIEAAGSVAAETARRLIAGEPRAPLLAAPLLGTPDAAELAARIANDPGFALRPDWRGEPHETGPLSRQWESVRRQAALGDRPVLARYLARVRELADLLLQINKTFSRTVKNFSEFFTMQASSGGGEGVACVQTARGLLVHWVAARENGIRDYRIVAPTEWNFHPDGPFARSLRSLAAADRGEAERGVRWLAQAFDPCAPLALEWADA
jgi:hypothetical protein